SAMQLDGVTVTTGDNARGAIIMIDDAIEYTLNECTTMGAYSMRLEKSEANLVTSNENTQASESTIRDADMAKEMVNYTKANVLSQSAQSMLAQANQNASSVLSLLQ
ncbi:MAG: flagellin, partial [Selenomonadaceae bacterium]|nr:flagellin [Selenomonadaceae bacterium]